MATLDVPSGTAIVHIGGSRQPKEKQTSIKAVMLGDYSVGKTALFKRIREKEAQLMSTSASWNSQSMDLCNLSIDIPNNKTVQLHLWDTAGAERYRTLTLDYFRKALIIFLIYRTDRLITLTNLTYWITEAQTYAPPNAIYVLVGNIFTDVKMEVSMELADDFARQHEIFTHIQLSATTAAEGNVMGMLRSAVEKVISSTTPPQSTNNTVQPSMKERQEDPNPRRKWCWCT